MKAKIIKGASFCQDARIIHANQERDVITGGNQKWNGAIPSFSIIAEMRRRFINLVENEDHWDRLVINIMLDPSAWAMKYLMAASVSWLILESVIIGINLSMLISIAIHRNTQFVLDRAIKDLIISLVVTITMKGLFI